MTTSFGVPQLQALVECRLALDGTGVALIADGGIRRHGALAEALLFGGDCAMLGSIFAGTEEAPGEIVHKSVVLPESQKTVKVPFKVLRGMASLEAIRDRLDVEDADKVELEEIGAEGMEISVPSRGIGAHDRPRDDQASLLVDQLRRRVQPERAAVAVLGRSWPLHDPPVAVGADASRTSDEPHGAAPSAPACARTPSRPTFPSSSASSRPGRANTAKAIASSA